MAWMKVRIKIEGLRVGPPMVLRSFVAKTARQHRVRERVVRSGRDFEVVLEGAPIAVALVSEQILLFAKKELGADAWIAEEHLAL